MTLLLRRLLVRFQDLLKRGQERLDLRPTTRLLPAIPWRLNMLPYLMERVSMQFLLAASRSLAQLTT